MGATKTNQEKYDKSVIKSNFKDWYPFPKELFAVEIRKIEIKMNMLVHLGQAILNLSNILMYEVHYDCMQLKYGSKAKLCYMEIDGFFMR